MARTLSLCIIARDEERCIARCLESVEGSVDEIVVVDTGSTDATPEIARQHGAKVFHFEWINDFSAARNETLKHATGDWVFNLDADETFMEDTGRIARDLIDRGESRAYRPLLISNETTNFVSARLFRREGVAFRYRIHEQPFHEGRVLESIDVPELRIWHDGHSEAVKASKGKKERNLAIAKLDMESYPGEPHPVMSYLWALLDLDPKSDEVIKIGHEVRRKFGMRDDRSTYLLFRAHRARGEEDKAQKVLQETLDAGVRHRYFLFERGRYYAIQENWEKALEYLDEGISAPPEVEGRPEGLTRVIRGLRGLALEGLLRFEESKAEYEAVLAEEPQNPACKAGLERVLQKLEILKSL